MLSLASPMRPLFRAFIFMAAVGAFAAGASGSGIAIVIIGAALLALS